MKTPREGSKGGRPVLPRPTLGESLLTDQRKLPVIRALVQEQGLFRQGRFVVRVMTFDRYLIASFVHVFVACFVAMFGLMIVVDLLENLDTFIDGAKGSGSIALVTNILRYYGFQAIFFLDRGGPAMTILAVVVVLILFQRSGEFYPLLAAGVPMYRAVKGLIAAAVVVTALLVANQELVVPQIAFQAYDSRGGAAIANQIESAYDHSNHISIDGQRLNLKTQEIEEARFVLPAPTLATEMTVLESKTARFREATAETPAGWVLQNVLPAPSELKLTEEGRQLVRTSGDGQSVFIATAITCDQLYRRSSSAGYLSTKDLLSRIHSPAFGMVSAHRMALHVHGRMVQPLFNLIAILIVIPLMVRRESIGLVVDSTYCGFILGGLFALQQGCQYLGAKHLLPVDLAAWLPVIVGGITASWLTGWIRT